MDVFDTLSQATTHYQQAGYTYDFNLLPEGIECKSLNEQFGPADFNVVAVHRFEGMSSEDDNSVLYAIESGGTPTIKGLLVDADGTYSEALSSDMIEKMKVRY